jgi:quercetin dioxygenase-like cupin family protein
MNAFVHSILTKPIPGRYLPQSQNTPVLRKEKPVARERNLVVEPGAGARVKIGGVGVDFKIWGEQTGGAFSIVEHPMDPRAVVAPHLHTKEDEFSYVIEGELGARQGDEEVRLGPGGYLMKPRGIVHAFWNPTDQPARILEIISPAGLEHCFEELGEYVATTEGQPDPGRIAEIAERYGNSFDFSWLPEIVERHGLTPPF